MQREQEKPVMLQQLAHLTLWQGGEGAEAELWTVESFSEDEKQKLPFLP